MHNPGNAKRAYGSGSIFEYRSAWYGQWRVDGRLVKRKLGPVRTPGTRDGLTKTQAEARLRKMIEDVVAAPVVERLTLDQAGRQLIRHLESLGRKKSTTEAYESFLRVHLVPYFRDRPLEKIGPEDVRAFMAKCRRDGRSVKSTLNYLGFLHGVFDFALKRGWTTSNPCKLVDKPRRADADPDIRYLDE